MTQLTNPTHFILLGASGDLAKKILPALSNQDKLNITLWSRKKLNYQVPNSYNIIQSDYISLESWNNLLASNSDQHLIVYMALPPVSYLGILGAINSLLIGKTISIDVVIEKPFATDSASMAEIIQYIEESHNLRGRVHFFDHFLFKDSLLLGQKSQTPPIQPLQSVTIRSLETIDVIGRMAFYDVTGATRDMISHLMFFAENFCYNMGLTRGFDWGQYEISRYDTDQYPGYNDNPELAGKISTTETFFDLELTNLALSPSTIRLISGKKQPARVWDIGVNGVNYNLLKSLPQHEHLNMIVALENTDYSRFVTVEQAQQMWKLIDRVKR